MKRHGFPIRAGDPVRLDRPDGYGGVVRIWARVVEPRAKDLIVDLTGVRVIVDGKLSVYQLGYVVQVTRLETWKPAGVATKRPAVERAAARRVRS